MTRIKSITDNLREEFDSLVIHPLQFFAWGEFRQKTGVKVVRQGLWQNGRLVKVWQWTIHQLPYTPWTIGYLPKGPMWNRQMLAALVEIGKENKCIFIKLEPNIKMSNVKCQMSSFDKLRMTLSEVEVSNVGGFHLIKSPHPLFPSYTLQIDLSKSEDELLKSFKPKTRYNLRLAERKGVVIKQDSSDEAFGVYLKLLKETTARDKFYAHNETYHRLMWQTLQPTGMAYLLLAKYKNMPLAAWILFKFKNTLYYPYGASSGQHRDLMASNLLMWEAIKLGKKLGCKTFDLWGSLGPNPDPKDPWFGFHRFKLGYHPRLVEFIGSYDLILKPQLYYLYNLTHHLRWLMLR